jgi:hypothetical protein
MRSANASGRPRCRHLPTASAAATYRARAVQPTGFGDGVVQRRVRPGFIMAPSTTWRNQMPLLLWLLGVPLVVVILLRVFGLI